jgi:hypothetical protein
MDATGYRISFSVLALVVQVVRGAEREKFKRPTPFGRIWTRVMPISKGEWPPAYRMSVKSLDSLGEGRIINGRF